VYVTGSRAWRSLAEGISALVDGDTLHLCPGEHAGQTYLDASGLTSGVRIEGEGADTTSWVGSGAETSLVLHGGVVTVADLTQRRRWKRGL
jgi:hypothetical protein